MTSLQKSLLLIEINALKTRVEKAQRAVYPRIQTWKLNTSFENLFLNLAEIKREISKADEE